MRASRRPSIDQLQPLLLDLPHPRSPVPPPPGAPLVWRDVFGRDRPVEIEVGCGKGLFLLTQSQARPDVSFLGVEIERKYALFTASRLLRAELSNVCIACTDARWLFQERIATASVAAVHIYFPDPWWKKRHHKRRVFTPEFAAQVARVLTPGGRLHFASDVLEYFEASLAMLAGQGRLHLLPESLPAHENSLTNFERKYRQQGRAIYRAVFTLLEPQRP